MSLSPSASVSNDEVALKRRRTTSDNVSTSADPMSPTASAAAPPTQHIPKRGARACTACRKGKNRCEGEAPCRRCAHNGIPCVYEKPEKKPPQGLPTASVERLSRLEGQFLVLQSQMIGMQSSLDRILSVIQSQQPNPTIGPSPQPLYSNGQSPPRETFVPPPRGQFELGASQDERARSFAPLSGFPPQPHKYSTYGTVPSTTPSSEDESEDRLPRATLNAPIEALQGLANAAAELAAAPSNEPPRVKKRKRLEPVPRNAFPHVIEKGLVSDSEARELYNIFFAGCHLFIPLFDPMYDTYESLMERTPWTFDAVLAIASKIRSGNGPLSPTFYKCLEEAQGIARSTLFGPIARKESVQGMLLLAAWRTNGWLPSGHALRMALDLGLHRALEKLVDNSKKRSDQEERDLVVSARIWLCIYWFDHQMSLGTGRPIVLRDDNPVRHCRLLLHHRMASPTDVRLVALVDLIAQKTQIYETLSPLDGQINHNTLSFIRRANLALDKWWSDCDELHRQTMDQDSLLRKVLTAELHYSKLWLVCVALRGASWETMSFEQRELAFQAKDAALNCISVFLTSVEYRNALRYAAHETLVTATFAGLFLLKMASLFPAELDLVQIIGQVEEVTHLLTDAAAGRYALALRIMLALLRRKVGICGVANIPGLIMPPPPFAHELIVSQTFVAPNSPPPFTVEELGFVWPSAGSIFLPSAIPVWLREENLADLGLPPNGSDDFLVQMIKSNGWTCDSAPVLETW